MVLLLAPREGGHEDKAPYLSGFIVGFILYGGLTLGLMAATGAVAHDAIEGYCVLGELALDGSIAAIAGALPAAIGANALGKGLICPRDSGAEAAWAATDMTILAPSNLLQLVNHFKGLQTLKRPPAMRRCRTCATSKARRPPSAHSKWPPPAGTTS